jgi:hypothetical protein
MAAIVAPTGLVEIVNGALADPAGTVTLGGTVTESPADNNTTAPPPGAAAVSVTVPVTGFPPTTLDVVNEIEASATGGPATVSVGDWLLLPLSDAEIVVVPAAIAVTVNVALNEPARIMTGVCTVATAGLLLVSVILETVDAAAARLTVPCPLLPTAMVVACSAIPDRAGAAAVGDVTEPEPPH